MNHLMQKYVGNLYKEGHFLKTWKVRKFELTGIHLVYFDPHGRKKGELNISGCWTRELTPEECGNSLAKYPFRIEGEGRQITLCASSEKTRSEWMMAIERQTTLHKDDYRHHLTASEIVLADGPVKLIKILGLSSQSATLVLTNLPRFLLVDPMKAQKLDELLWELDNSPIFTKVNISKFRIALDGKSFQMEDSAKGSEYWYNAFISLKGSNMIADKISFSSENLVVIDGFPDFETYEASYEHEETTRQPHMSRSDMAAAISPIAQADDSAGAGAAPSAAARAASVTTTDTKISPGQNVEGESQLRESVAMEQQFGAKIDKEAVRKTGPADMARRVAARRASLRKEDAQERERGNKSENAAILEASDSTRKHDGQENDAERIAGINDEIEQPELSHLKPADADSIEAARVASLEHGGTDVAARKAQEREQEQLDETFRKEKEREEADRKEKEREEADRKEKEREEAVRKEKEREEADRKEKEREEADRKEKEREEAARKEKEREEAVRKEKEREEADCKEKEREEADRKEKEREEADRREKEREEAVREEKEREEAARKEKECEEDALKQKEEKENAESASRHAADEAARWEAEQSAKRDFEAQKLALELVAKKQQERRMVWVAHSVDVYAPANVLEELDGGSSLRIALMNIDFTPGSEPSWPPARPPIGPPSLREDTESIIVQTAEVFPMDPSHLQDLDDLCKMNNLQEAPLLDVLRRRFAADKIYTNIGNLLISINPYKTIGGLYDASKSRSYFDVPSFIASSRINTIASSTGSSSGIGSGAVGSGGAGSAAVQGLAPHVYAIANSAFCELMQASRVRSASNSASSFGSGSAMGERSSQVKPRTGATTTTTAAAALFPASEPSPSSVATLWASAGPRSTGLTSSGLTGITTSGEANGGNTGGYVRPVNQSIIVTGESGAGKTEASKHVISFLTMINSIKKVSPSDSKTSRSANTAMGGNTSTSSSGSTGSGVGKLGTRLKDLIMQSNSIFESFGNAKTVRNDNSSRFGKYIKLEYSDCGFGAELGTRPGAAGAGNGFVGHPQLVSAVMETFLLERSRITSVAENERNFHVFYRLVRGLASSDPSAAARLHLTSVEAFHILVQGRCTAVVPGQETDDVAEFGVLDAALRLFGCSGQVIDKLWELMAAILHLGNARCGPPETDGEAARIQVDSLALGQIASLLGIPEQLLLLALTKQKFSITRSTGRVSTSYKILSVLDVQNNVSALIKWLYKNIFAWIVGVVNKALEMGGVRGDDMHLNGGIGSVLLPPKRFIGILDIFGFEILLRNSFEQLCINFTNERLQQQFNEHVFVLEQQEYAREGLDWASISYRDNQNVIDLISKKPYGLLLLLEEHGMLNRKPDDVALLQAYNLTHDQKQRGYSKSRFANDGFVIQHFAGDVNYAIDGFLAKNNDSLQTDLLEVFELSDNDFLVSSILHTGITRATAEPRKEGGRGVGEEGEAPATFSATTPTSSLSGATGTTAIAVPTIAQRRLSLNMSRDSSSPASSPTKPATAFWGSNSADAYDEVNPQRPISLQFPPGSTGGKRSSVKMAATSTVSFTFREQLNSLVASLRSTVPHYIKCIKPNELKTSEKFDAKLVMEQLKYSGVMEVVRIRREGFPTRVGFIEFYYDYYLLAFGRGWLRPIECSQELAKIYSSTLANDVLGKEGFQIGQNFVFLRTDSPKLLREAIRRVADSHAVRLQAIVRRGVCRLRYRKVVASLRLLQRVQRGARSRKRVRRMCELLLLLQRACRGFLFRREITRRCDSRRRAVCAVKLQCMYRKYSARARITERRCRLARLHRLVAAMWRGAKVRRLAKARKLCARKLSALVRGCLVRRRLRQMRVAALHIQRVYRGTKVYRASAILLRAALRLVAWAHKLMELRIYRQMQRRLMARRLRGVAAVQRLARSYLMRRRAAFTIQCAMRRKLRRLYGRRKRLGLVARRKNKQIKTLHIRDAAVIIIQTYFRTKRQRLLYLKTMRALPVVQRFLVTVFPMYALQKARESATKLAVLFRGLIVSRRYVRMKMASVKIQRMSRRVVIQRRVARLHCFCAAADVAQVDSLLQLFPYLRDVRYRGAHLCNIFHSAALSGDISMLKALQMGIDDIFTKDAIGDTVLQWCVKKKSSVAMLRFLWAMLDEEYMRRNPVSLGRTKALSSAAGGRAIQPGRVLKAGWLLKRKRKKMFDFNPWQRRWVVLTGEHLSLNYSEQPTQQPATAGAGGGASATPVGGGTATAGVFPIKESTVEVIPGRDPVMVISSRHMFSKKTLLGGAHSKPLTLKGESERQVGEWMAAIEAMAELKVDRTRPLQFSNLTLRELWVASVNKYSESALHALARANEADAVGAVSADGRHKKKSAQESEEEQLVAAAWLVDSGCPIGLKSARNQTALQVAIEKRNEQLSVLLWLRGGATAEANSSLSPDELRFLQGAYARLGAGASDPRDLSHLPPSRVGLDRPPKEPGLSYLSIAFERLVLSSEATIVSRKLGQLILSVCVYSAAQDPLEAEQRFPRSIFPSARGSPTEDAAGAGAAAGSSRSALATAASGAASGAIGAASGAGAGRGEDGAVWGCTWRMQTPLERLRPGCYVVLRLLLGSPSNAAAGSSTNSSNTNTTTTSSSSQDSQHSTFCSALYFLDMDVVDAGAHEWVLRAGTVDPLGEITRLGLKGASEPPMGHFSSAVTIEDSSAGVRGFSSSSNVRDFFNSVGAFNDSLKIMSTS